MKKALAAIAAVFLMLSFANAEFMEEIIFVPGAEQTLVTSGAFAVDFTGVYRESEGWRGKRLEFPVIMINYSDRAEFGLIIDQIIINGWDTPITVKMFPCVSKRGKMMETIYFNYESAGIKRIDEIESVIFRAHMYDQDLYDYKLNPTSITFNWIRKSVYWVQGEETFHTHADCAEIKSPPLSGTITQAFDAGNTEYCYECRDTDGIKVY